MKATVDGACIIFHPVTQTTTKGTWSECYLSVFSLIVGLIECTLK